MTRHNVRVLATTLLLLALAFVFTRSASAQSKSLVWERMDTEIVVGEDGTLYISEINVVRFTQGTFTFGFRDIPYFRLTDVYDVRVSELDPQSGSEIPLRVEQGRDNERLRVKYYFSRPAEQETRTFILRYTVDGAVRYYEKGDQVWWGVVYADRNGFSVRQARATLRLPEGATVQRAEVYGVRAEVRGVGSTTVVAEAREAIPNGVTMELRVQFLHGVVRGTPPPWQREFDMQREFEEKMQLMLDPVFLLIGLLFALGGPALAAVIYTTRGRDPDVGSVAEYLTKPPDIPPGLGGALYDERANVQDIVATIVDLAQRGVLQLHEEEPKLWMIKRGPSFGNVSLDPLEHELIRQLGLDIRDSRSLNSLHQRFYPRLRSLQNTIYDELVIRGYYRRSPEWTRQEYMTIAWQLIVLAVMALIAALTLAQWANFGVFPTIGLFIAGIAFAIIAPHMPVRTWKGTEMRMRVVAFRRYLQHIEQFADVNGAASTLFERYLPWAIALGLQRRWMRKFRNAPISLPSWYIPHPVSLTGSRNVLSGGGTGTQLAGFGSSMPDISGAAIQMPSLAQLEQGIGQSLSAFERNLSNMFDTLARNLASRPSAGAGWSGGGSRRGGFSGGGSGGFG